MPGRRCFVKGALGMAVAGMAPAWPLRAQPSLADPMRAKVPGPIPTLAALDASLAAAGVGRADREWLAGLAQPGVALQDTYADDADIPVGASKAGGDPDLPDGMAWPTRPPTSVGRKEVEVLRQLQATQPAVGDDYLTRQIAVKEPLARREAPLAFLLQVDLAACAATGPLDPDIPRAGRLLLFYDMVFLPGYGHDKEGNALFRLVHLDGGTDTLRRRTPPDMGAAVYADEPPLRDRLPSAVLKPVYTYTVPDFGSAPVLGRYAMAGRYPHQAWVEADGGAAALGTRLGGWPANIQNDMAMELAAMEAGVEPPYGTRYPEFVRMMSKRAQQWVMLLQVVSYGDVDYNGNYYVWIKREHLRARDFSKARLIYQTD